MAKGDHIYIQQLPHTHHGIDCGDDSVIPILYEVA
ncbi:MULTISPECIES: lecithin retinol acyltransferase family protein [unclassified Microcoleus]